MDPRFKTIRRTRRKNRVRAKISGTAKRPRLAIFRSNTQITAQLIDDENAVTLGFASTAKEKGATLKERAMSVGATIATIAKGKGADAVVFDRGGYLYAGNIKALADAAREAGLTF